MNLEKLEENHRKALEMLEQRMSEVGYISLDEERAMLEQSHGTSGHPKADELWLLTTHFAEDYESAKDFFHAYALLTQLIS